MAKVQFSAIVEQVNGQFGNAIFRKYKDRIILCRKPNTEGRELTAAQTAHRERFRKAVEFGKLIMSNPETRTIYEQVAERKDIPVYALCIADYFTAPTIESINTASYKGKAGDIIEIVASDDVSVTRVDVALSNNASGAAIESGQAVELAGLPGHWVYTATKAATAGITVKFQVTATDRPGGTKVETSTKGI